MSQKSKHDAWNAGEAYDAYMGRWSRRIAEDFLAWLNPDPGLGWLDVGCGTGYLLDQLRESWVPLDRLHDRIALLHDQLLGVGTPRI